MENDPFWAHVKEVLQLLKQHSEIHQQPKSAATALQRLSGWAGLVGGVIYVGAEVLRQVGHP